MIKANEFRIGSLVMDRKTGEWLRVVELTENDIITSVIDRSKFPLPDGWNMQPILLTPEILEKFGWVWNEETNTFEKYPNGDARMHLQYREVDSSYTMFNYVLRATISERIWFLHQLQNLYFALTGKELEIIL